MGVPSGANNKPPCASTLCGHMPKNFERNGGREGGGGEFRDSLLLQHICGIQFYIHQDLVYHVSGGTERIWKYGPPGGAEDNAPGI